MVHLGSLQKIKRSKKHIQLQLFLYFVPKIVIVAPIITGAQHEMECLSPSLRHSEFWNLAWDQVSKHRLTHALVRSILPSVFFSKKLKESTDKAMGSPEFLYCNIFASILFDRLSKTEEEAGTRRCISSPCAPRCIFAIGRFGFRASNKLGV